MEQRIVLVTGGARGIGASILRRFAKTGDRVWFVDVSEDAVREAEQTFRAEGLDVEGRQGDVSDFEGMKELIDAIIEKDGRLDVLINNAGITRDTLLMRMSESQWDQVLDVNLKGAFNTVRHAVKPMMKQRSGCVVNISSVVGLMGNAGQVNYSAAKAGMFGLTKTLARELAGRNIRVNAVAPGFVSTEMTEQLSEQAQQELKRQIPLGRTASPEDIANAVFFLAGEEASYITGHTLSVDGGMRM